MGEQREDPETVEADEPEVVTSWASPFGIEGDKRMAELEGDAWLPAARRH